MIFNQAAQTQATARREVSIRDDLSVSKSVKTSNSLMEKLFNNLKDLNDEATAINCHLSVDEDDQDLENHLSLQAPQFGLQPNKAVGHTRSFGQALNVNHTSMSHLNSIKS